MPDPDPLITAPLTPQPPSLWQGLSRWMRGISSSPVATVANGTAASVYRTENAAKEVIYVDTAELANNVAELRNMEAYDVMVPRADIVGINLDDAPKKHQAVLKSCQFNRLPVFRGSLDDVAGYVQLRDITTQLLASKPLDLGKLLHKPLFIVGSMRVLDLLAQMRHSKVYLALVVDEYGGIDGLITIEDLMEAILGTVQKDTSNGDQKIIVQENGLYLIDARAELEEFEEILGLSLDLPEEERDEVDTVGGLVSMLAGRVPARGEIIKYNGTLEFEVMDADPRRVRCVKAKKTRAA